MRRAVFAEPGTGPGLLPTPFAKLNPDRRKLQSGP